MGTGLSLQQLYRECGEELVDLSARMRTLYLDMRRAGYGATFSDLDGEILYLLVRQLRPEIVYEISPDCGYSTNYLTAALSANGTGRLYSFELEAEKRGEATGDVVRRHLLHALPDRLEIVIGDASQRVSEFPDPDLVLLDSCHEAWFARWYIEKLFPRVRRLAFVQDVAYHDRPEFSGEAEVLAGWLRAADRPVWSVAAVEASPELARWRAALAPRRPYENNSVVIPLDPELRLADATPLSPLESPFGHDALLDELPLAKLDILHQGMLPRPVMPNVHRRWLRLGGAYGVSGLPLERDRCYRRALGAAVFASPEQGKKGLHEAAVWFARERRPTLLAAALGLAASHGPRVLWAVITGTVSDLALALRSRLRAMLRHR